MKTGIVCGLLTAAALTGFAQNPAPRGHSATSHIVTRGAYLGVGLGEVTPDRVKALKLKDDKGVEITLVDDNSPAARAGLRENDVVLEINGQNVDSREEFVRMVAESTPGAKVSLLVWRNGSKQSVSATLAARPAAYFGFPANPSGAMTPLSPMAPFPPDLPDISSFPMLTGESPRIGVEGEPLSGQLADFFGVKAGVLVRSVDPNSAAAKAGMKAGDVIVKVNSMPVSNIREISGLIRAAHKTATFTVVRNHKEILLNVEIAFAEQTSDQPS